jgi:hypothetical protein
MKTRVTDTPLARVGNVDVSKFETATGPRLRLRRAGSAGAEAYLDPLELEGLTRLRYKPIAVLSRTRTDRERPGQPAKAETVEHLQNEFAMVGVGISHANSDTRLVITDMTAGQTIFLTSQELEALLAARHMDLAPLIDTSDLVAIPEPDIDQA